MSNFDVLSVGDIVTDAFIKLLDDQAEAYENEKGKWLAIPFGQKVPFHHVEILEAVGNAANASVSFARLGLKSGLVANVGGDMHGRDMITSLQKSGVDSRFVHINHDKMSNYHYVLWYKEERTILIKHEEYDYHWPHFREAEIPKWLYFSSISENALDYHDDIADWLVNRHPGVKFAFQPGTFQIKAGIERLGKLYARADVLVVNREEAVQITGGDYHDIHGLFNRLHEIGAKVVCITDGPDGAYASDGEHRFRMPPYPDPGPPVERTGAGDAFASTFVAALVKGNDIEGALQWAPINSMNVVQNVGAQNGLLSEKKLEEFLKNAPDWYKPEKF
jgi:ribokinase